MEHWGARARTSAAWCYVALAEAHLVQHFTVDPVGVHLCVGKLGSRTGAMWAMMIDVQLYVHARAVTRQRRPGPSAPPPGKETARHGECGEVSPRHAPGNANIGTISFYSFLHSST